MRTQRTAVRGARGRAVLSAAVAAAVLVTTSVGVAAVSAAAGSPTGLTATRVTADGGVAGAFGLRVTVPPGAVAEPVSVSITDSTAVAPFPDGTVQRAFTLAATTESTGAALAWFALPVTVVVAAAVSPGPVAVTEPVPTEPGPTGPGPAETPAATDPSVAPSAEPPVPSESASTTEPPAAAAAAVEQAASTPGPASPTTSTETPVAVPRVATLAADGTWSLLPTTPTPDGLAFAADSPGTFAVVSVDRATGLTSDHVVLGAEGPSGIGYQAPDLPLVEVEAGAALRVRFQLGNPGPTAVTTTPMLLQRDRAGGEYTPAPTDLSSAADLTVVAEPTAVAVIPVDELLLPAPGPSGTAVSGRRSLGGNPLGSLTLGPQEVTEVEFVVRVADSVSSSSGVELRLSDPAAPIGAAVSAWVRLPTATASTSDPAGTDPSAPVAAPAAAVPTPVLGTHGPYSGISDQCAICHRTHTARNVNLLTEPGSQSALCFTCHNGTGASTNVQAQYTDPSVPANDEATRSYYSHDALSATSHVRSGIDEFGGVSNRHSECSDCHNPHQAQGIDSSQPTPATPWTASGRLLGASGVAVTNGAAGTSPSYTFLDGVTSPITAEYQLCLKCHSGNTVLLSNDGVPASRQTLDKGVELNPNNPSFHPVEAPGTNQTAAMAASLSGSSPYKRWTFTPTSTIRCTNCHATSASLGQLPAPGSDLSTHTSAYRGILLANYQDRVLNGPREAYDAADFALCYLCHTDAPFRSGGGASATNFRAHAKHVSGLSGNGNAGTDIDTPGDGGGNALCAECHFRIHSTSFSVGTAPGSRLVSFSPNVQPYQGTLSFEPQTTAGPGSCTLVCHGKVHNAKPYR